MSFEAHAITGGMQWDVSSFVGGMLKVNAISEMFPSVVKSFIAEPLLGIMEVAREAAHALKELFLGSMERADLVGRTAGNLGMAAEQFSALARAAEYADLTMEDTGEAIKFLNRNIVNALTGNEDMLASFRALGMGTAELQAALRDPHAGILMLADGFKALPEGAIKSAMAMDVLGRSGTHMVEFMSFGSAKIRELEAQAREFGAVVSEAGVERGEKWHVLTTQLSQMWAGVKAQLAAPIAAAVLPELEKLVAWFRSNPEEIKAIVQEVVAGLTKALSTLASVVRFVAEHFDTIVKVLGAAGLIMVVKGAIGGLISLGESFMALIPKIAAATAAQTSFNAAAMAGRAAMGAGIGAGVGGLVGGGGMGSIVGGSIGGLAGGLIGQALIPIPGVGFLIGSIGGGLIGGAIGGSFDEKPVININNPVTNVDVKDAGKRIAEHNEEMIGRALNTLNSRRSGERVELSL